MSCYFEMRFLQVHSREKMFNTCTRFANTLANKSIAREYLQTLLSRTEKVPVEAMDRERFIQAAFQVRFVYWPQYNLLGLPTKGWPEEAFNDFGFTAPIQFQSNTDQDYPLETWDDAIPVFTAVKKHAAKQSDFDILRDMGWEEPDIDDPQFFEAMAYARRSFVYRKIYNCLDLDNWLEGNEGKFERFVLSGVTTSEQLSWLSLCFRVMIMDQENASPVIRNVLWESAFGLGSNLSDDSIRFLLSETGAARRTGSIRPGSYLSDLVVNYKADQDCLFTDLALKEVEAALKSLLAARYLEVYEGDEDARKNGWLQLYGNKKEVKLIRGQRQEGDAWDYAVIAAEWGGEMLILETFPDAKSAQDFIKDNGYTCVASEF